MKKNIFFFCVWEKKKEPMQSKRKEEPHDRVGGQWCCHSVVCKCVFSFLCVALCVFFGMLNLIFDQTFCHFSRRWRVHINSNETLRACRFHYFLEKGRLSSLLSWSRDEELKIENVIYYDLPHFNYIWTKSGKKRFWSFGKTVLEEKNFFFSREEEAKGAGSGGRGQCCDNLLYF